MEYLSCHFDDDDDVEGMRLCLLTAATNGSVVRLSGDV
jgi:hypothetical protein